MLYKSFVFSSFFFSERRPMTDPPRYGKRRTPPLQSTFTTTKRQLDTSLSFLTKDNVVLKSQTSYKLIIKKILWAALARAVVRRLSDNMRYYSYPSDKENVIKHQFWYFVKLTRTFPDASMCLHVNVKFRYFTTFQNISKNIYVWKYGNWFMP